MFVDTTIVYTCNSNMSYSSSEQCPRLLNGQLFIIVIYLCIACCSMTPYSKKSNNNGPHDISCYKNGTMECIGFGFL